MKIHSFAVEWRGIESLYGCRHWDEQVPAVSEWITFLENKIYDTALQNGSRQHLLKPEAAKWQAESERAALRRAFKSKINGSKLCKLNERALLQMGISEIGRAVIFSELANLQDNSHGVKLVMKLDCLRKGLDNDLLYALRDAEQHPRHDIVKQTVIPAIPADVVQVKLSLSGRDPASDEHRRYEDQNITHVHITLDLRELSLSQEKFEYPATIPIGVAQYAIEAIPSSFSSRGIPRGIYIQISFT